MHTMNVTLLSCYELGRQPLGIAFPAAHLRAAGFDVECLDLAVEPLIGNLHSRNTAETRGKTGT